MLRQLVVMVGTDLSTKGGVSAVVNQYQLAGLFTRWPITYISTHVDGWFGRKLKIAALGLLRFTALLIAGRVSVVHVHSASNASFWRKCWFIWLAWLAGRPVIFHLHGGGFLEFFGKQRYVGRRLIRATLDSVSSIVVLSESWKAAVTRICGNQNISVIHNPIQCPSDVGDTGTQRQMDKLLFVGRLNREKGVYDLLEAMSRLSSEFRSISLVVAGDGDSAELMAYARSLQVEDRIHTVGWIPQDEVAALLRSASVFVLPSYYEAMPMALLEAMSAGIPVVTSRVGAIPEIVTDGVDGLLITAGDVSAITHAVKRILSDSELSAEMGRAAQRKVRRCFSPEHIVQQVEQLYVELGASR